VLKKETDKQDIKIAVPRPALSIDWDLYLEYLKDSDLSEQQKREFIETLLAIVISAVDLGFGVHPVQQAAGNICEQQAEIAKFIAAQSASVLTSSKNSKKTFNASTDRQSGPSQERSPE